MIKVLIFDLGRVIVPFDHEIGLQILEQHCAFLRDDIRAKIFASNELLLYQMGRISSDEFFAAMKTALNIKISFEEFAKIWNSSFTFTPLIDEAVIERLTQKYRLLILSDTNALHFEFIREKFPIMRHFDDFVLSHEIGILKPSEEIFRIAVKRAGCAAKECIFIDDLPANVEGARKIGIHTVQFISSEQFQNEIEKIISGEQAIAF